MNFGSVCTGIAAPEVAWIPLGWKPVFFAEIEKFPSNILKHHYPGVLNAGDFTAIQDRDYDPIDLLVGGTPCQDFSVAGLRAGMDGARGQLTVEFAHLAGRLRPRWLVWENVPGVLSIDGGRAFGTFLGLLGQLGYGIAYRVLDAQHFGVPQRRRRVFVVGYLGDWRRAAAVLFERQSLSGYPAPRREKGQVAPTIPSRSLGGGGFGTDFDCDGGLVIAHSLRADGFDASEDGTGRGTPLVVVAHTDVLPTMQNDADTPAAHSARSGDTKDAYIVPVIGFRASGQDGFTPSEVGPPISATDGGGAGVPTIAFSVHSQNSCAMKGKGDALAAFPTDVARALDSAGFTGQQGGTLAMNAMAVRRLTPRECERLQGFPDDYTRISDKTADGPRYKALGNSMAVPVMRWIGERIDMVEAIA